MLRKIYASILSLFAIAASMPANAWEWREFSKTDFGGNDEASRIICEVQNEENAIETDLTFYPWNRNYTPGSYMIIKATQLADVGGGYNLTNWGEALSGAPRWASGGDHTNPDDPNKGYFMAFDCPSKLKVQLYKQELPVAGSGVKFKLEAYFAVLDWRNVASNDVEIAIESEGKTLAKASLNSESNSDWKAVSQNFKWVPLSLEASVDDPSITSVDFVVNAINCEPAGWDFGLDDITISVEQPKITYKNETYKYQKPATLKVTYDESEFDDFFKNSSNVKYQWYKDDGTGNFVALSEAGGAYTSGKDLSLTIPSFDKNVDNGKYRLVVAPGDNFGDGNNQNLCAIQKDIVIDQEINEVDVIICKDSTKIVEGVTLTPTLGVVEEYKKGIGTGGQTLGFRITVIDWVLGDNVITNYCLGGTHTVVGDNRVADIITRDENNCPIKIQEAWEHVDTYVQDEQDDICEGDHHITDNNADHIWRVGEDKEILFENEGCIHIQNVVVHPTENVFVDVQVCQGEAYDNSVKIYKTIYGCDSIVTPNIITKHPKEVTIEYVKCLSDNFEFDGVIYNQPIDTKVIHHDISVDGCDSTTTIHIVIMDGGEIHMDTLICKDQILFGKEYTTEGEYTVVRPGATESGCTLDTVWRIKVMDASLKIRAFNDNYEICEGQPVSLRVTLSAFDPEGKGLHTEYHWEPEVPDNSLNPTLYLDQTTEYTFYADFNLPSDANKNAKGCHVKESFTINVHKSPKLTIDSIDSQNGNVEVSIKEGTAPYQIFVDINPISSTDDNLVMIEKLNIGTHVLQVVDSVGCSSEEVIEIKGTAVDDILADPSSNDDNNYNVNGQKVASPTRGKVYINNGKKVMYK